MVWEEERGGNGRGEKENGEQDEWEKKGVTDSCYQIAVTFLTRSFVIVSRTFPLRFLIWDETKSLFTRSGGEEAWGVGGEQEEGERGGGQGKMGGGGGKEG